MPEPLFRIFLVHVGYARALELYLAALKLCIGLTILITDIDRQTAILADLAWYHSSAAIAAPFFLVGGLQMIGWWLNLFAVENNWVWRATAAILAIFLWSALLLKSGLVGDVTVAIPLAILNLPSSSFLLWRAWNRLPIPGALGTVRYR